MALVFTCKVCVWGGEEQPWHIDYLLSFYTQANEFRMNYTLTNSGFDFQGSV